MAVSGFTTTVRFYPCRARAIAALQHKGNVMSELTPAQRRALMWLPADGSTTLATPAMSGRIGSLTLFHPELVVVAMAPGNRRNCYRLTEAGMEERRRMEDMAEPASANTRQFRPDSSADPENPLVCPLNHDRGCS
jgi:hypothetical protein